HAYELEACASDFYRFILGTDRAAKTRVVFDETNFFVASQKNPAGFKHQTRDNLLANQPESYEVDWLQSVLDEGDQNEANSGFNDAGQGSVIDFDLTLYKLKIQLFGTAVWSRHREIEAPPVDMFIP